MPMWIEGHYNMSLFVAYYGPIMVLVIGFRFGSLAEQGLGVAIGLGWIRSLQVGSGNVKPELDIFIK